MTRLHATGLVLVGLLVGALLSVPSSAATGSGGTTAAPAAAAARLSPQRFLLLQTNPKQHRPMVAAFGAIHDHGRDIVLGRTGTGSSSSTARSGSTTRHAGAAHTITSTRPPVTSASPSAAGGT